MCSVRTEDSEAISIMEAIEAICLEQLSIKVGSRDTDLFATGILDSMVLVELILRLEQRFGCALPIHEVGLEPFRTLESIAELVARCLPAADARRTA